jgi:Ser/Thr protein kinase RdoA (MazF antagonist)
MVYDEQGTPWRLLPYVGNSECHNIAPTLMHAHNAAAGFARLTRFLSDIPLHDLEDAFPQFHDLTLREEQLREALNTTEDSRTESAHDVVRGFQEFSYIGDRYREVIRTGVLKKRIQHHDTKLNNILFRSGTAETLAVIDLDLIMPGYFFSDIGELIMWGTSVFEDENDLTKVTVNDTYYDAIINGYRDEMGDALSTDEHALISFSPLVMCYMLGIRFLADYLNGEVYFKTKYEGQNLDKARNRLKLLEELAQRGS